MYMYVFFLSSNICMYVVKYTDVYAYIYKHANYIYMCVCICIYLCMQLLLNKCIFRINLT